MLTLVDLFATSSFEAASQEYWLFVALSHELVQLVFHITTN